MGRIFEIREIRSSIVSEIEHHATNAARSSRHACSLYGEHLADSSRISELQARIASYELAYQLQTSAPEVMDLAGEDARTLEMYGINDPKPTNHKLALGPSHFGKQCLIARRLIERGTRFVQIYSGGGHQQQNWTLITESRRTWPYMDRRSISRSMLFSPI